MRVMASSHLCFGHLAILSPARAETPQELDVSYIRNDEDQVTLSKSRGLAPIEVPKFVLHGTSGTGVEMLPYTRYFQSLLDARVPVYDSYVPEIRYSKGVHRINPYNGIPESGQPAYVMVLRDMGDFRHIRIINRYPRI